MKHFSLTEKAVTIFKTIIIIIIVILSIVIMNDDDDSLFITILKYSCIPIVILLMYKIIYSDILKKTFIEFTSGGIRGNSSLFNIQININDIKSIHEDIKRNKIYIIYNKDNTLFKYKLIKIYRMIQ